jgi:hypothetical protein
VKSFQVDLLDDYENVETEDGMAVEVGSVWEVEEDFNDVRLTSANKFLNIDEQTLRTHFVKV